MYLGYEEITTVFLELNMEEKNIFLCSPILHLKLQVLRKVKCMICVSSSGTLNEGRRQEYEDLQLSFFQISEKSCHWRWNVVKKKVRVPGVQEEICPKSSTDCSISWFSLWIGGDPTISLLNSLSRNVLPKRAPGKQNISDFCKYPILPFREQNKPHSYQQEVTEIDRLQYLLERQKGRKFKRGSGTRRTGLCISSSCCHQRS